MDSRCEAMHHTQGGGALMDEWHSFTYKLHEKNDREIWTGTMEVPDRAIYCVCASLYKRHNVWEMPGENQEKGKGG